MLDAILIILGVVGLAGGYDKFCPPDRKAAVAEYVFGGARTDFGTFERAAMEDILLPFVGEAWEGPSWRAGFVLSGLCILVLALLNNGGRADPRSFYDLVGLVGFGGLISLPFVMFSLHVSNCIFVMRVWPRPLPVLIAVDAGLSLLPLVILASLAMAFFGVFDETPEWLKQLSVPLLLSAFWALPAVLFVTAVQIAVLLFGTLTRIILLALRSAGRMADPKKLYQAPFTAIGLVAGLVIALLKLTAATLG
ncbi:hypothetical protein AB0T83_04860 [Fluviibacterium sp. DFM31]|uniref:Yip1 domain-containing protein n=1 Tax=Meridianimarinicoccus marinus TaxID=3231483 RepID=A0ABV3L3Q4_9RHOB